MKNTGVSRGCECQPGAENTSKNNALFMTMSRIPLRVRNLDLIEHSTRAILGADTHLTANPRGSRNSSEVPVSPPTVLIRTSMNVHLSTK